MCSKYIENCRFAITFTTFIAVFFSLIQYLIYNSITCAGLTCNTLKHKQKGL